MSIAEREDISCICKFSKGPELESESLELPLSDLHISEQRQPTKKNSTSSRIPYSTFQHTSISFFPPIPRDFFLNCREVATFQSNELYCTSHLKRPEYPCLSFPVVMLAGSCNIKYKIPYLGVNLYDGYEDYIPMSPKLLDDSTGCFEYIKHWEAQGTKKYNEGKITVISPRHHIVELVMALFQTDSVAIICTYVGGGRILFSEDQSMSTAKTGIHSSNLMTKKICYSGFSFEDKLKASEGTNDSPFFSIVEGELNDRITLLLRCEMDAYNKVKGCYTELKCFTKLKMHNIHHRRKLLKTWVQIGLIPSSDLIVGTRGTQAGELEDLLWFSKESLYRKVNNSSLPSYHSFANFNADIAVQWFHHCIESICDLIMNNITKSSLQSFKITIDAGRNISIKKLSKVPKHVQVAKEYLVNT